MKKYLLILSICIANIITVYASEKNELAVTLTLEMEINGKEPSAGLSDALKQYSLFGIKPSPEENRCYQIKEVSYMQDKQNFTWPLTNAPRPTQGHMPPKQIADMFKSSEQDLTFPHLITRVFLEATRDQKLMINNQIPVNVVINDPNDALGFRRQKIIFGSTIGLGCVLFIALLAYLYKR